MSSQMPPEGANRPIFGTAVFRTGESILESGLYAVMHSVHRLPQTIFLAAGQKFPRCSRCTEAVTFWILKYKNAPVGVDLRISSLPVEDEKESGR